jgi:hypothetical protein
MKNIICKISYIHVQEQDDKQYIIHRRTTEAVTRTAGLTI